ncbi:MAG TPA: hypothetical protein VKT51_01625 [Candidatus Eremiobacteraceae bacterium]|nr:hypothetical protein [Candidatus Eremiobacteraceae bacterium]
MDHAFLIGEGARLIIVSLLLLAVGLESALHGLRLLDARGVAVAVAVESLAAVLAIEALSSVVAFVAIAAVVPFVALGAAVLYALWGAIVTAFRSALDRPWSFRSLESFRALGAISIA